MLKIQILYLLFCFVFHGKDIIIIIIIIFIIAHGIGEVTGPSSFVFKESI